MNIVQHFIESGIVDLIKEDIGNSYGDFQGEVRYHVTDKISYVVNYSASISNSTCSFPAANDSLFKRIQASVDITSATAFYGGKELGSVEIDLDGLSRDLWFALSTK